MPRTIAAAARAAPAAPAPAEARRVYDAGQTHQDSWGWKVSAYLWTKSIAAGVMLPVPFLTGWSSPEHGRDLRLAAIAIALVFLTATGALLVADLKRPERFLWVVTRPQWRSWLTRGAYILLLFSLALAGVAAAELAGARGLAPILGWVTAVLAVGAATYTAFLFWQSKGRDLWQSPLLPLHLLTQAAVAGLAVMLLLALAGPPVPAPAQATLVIWLQAAIGVHALLALVELYAVHPTQDARTAARWARTGWRLHLLVWGVIGLGAAAPIALLFSDDAAALAAASVTCLAGLLAWEHLYVKAGQRVALS